MTTAPPVRPEHAEALAPAALVELAADSQPWLDFLASRPEATPFHHPAWSGVLATCYGYRSTVLAVTAGGRVVAGLPVLTVPRPLSRARAISLPFTDHLEALVAGEEWRPRLAAAAVAWSASCGTPLEVRGDLGTTPGIERAVFEVRHVLPLSSDPASVLPRLHRRARRGLNRLRESRLQARLGTSEETLRDFYRIHIQTRRRLGVPIQPRRFFDLLWERMLDRGLGFCVTALLDGIPVAAAVFLDWNGTVVYKFGASDPAYWRLFPNHLVFWTAIRHGCERGATTFDLGRSDLNHHSLRTFKSEWGVEQPIVTSGIGEPPRARPEGATQRLLATVIQHSPAAVCRALGELLYRYFP